MFWSTFNKLQLLPDQLRPYHDYLYDFVGNQVEVRGTWSQGRPSQTIPHLESLISDTSSLTLCQLTTGKSNFEDVLASQKYGFGKAGLGFYPQRKENKITKAFSSVSEKQSVKKLFQPVVTCFYCMKKDHSVKHYRFCKSLVPKGIFKWIPRCIIGSKDKFNTEGPNFFKGSNLVI